MDTLVREQFSFSGGTVDESGPFPAIRGVLMCGDSSKWGYDYLKEAWSDETLKAYEGIPSYANHDKAGESRDVLDKVGWFENIRRRADGKPEGDYFLIPEHPMTPRLIRAAKHNPKLFAMSHRAHVKWGSRGGRKVVEGVTRPISVDVVGEGATTGGLFESADKGGKSVATVKEYLDKLAPKCGVEQLLVVKELVREDAYGSATMGSDAPAADGAETKPEDGIKAAFKAAIMGLIDKCLEGDGGDAKECLQKIKKLLNSHGDFKGGKSGDGGGKGEEEDDEGGKAKEGQPKLPDSWEVVRECADEKLEKPTASQLLALGHMPKKEDRLVFIREQKGLLAATNPKSQGRDRGDQGGKDGKGKDGTVKEGAGGGQGEEVTGVAEAQSVMAKLSADLRGVPAK